MVTAVLEDYTNSLSILAYGNDIQMGKISFSKELSGERGWFRYVPNVGNYHSRRNESSLC